MSVEKNGNGNGVTQKWVNTIILALLGGILLFVANAARDEFIRLSSKVDVVALDVAAIKTQNSLADIDRQSLHAEMQRLWAAKRANQP